VHEVVDTTVVVEVLHLPLLNAGSRPARAGLEGALDDVTLANVLQLHAYLRGAARHLDVGPIQHLHELPVELDDDSLLDIAGADHRKPRPPWRPVMTPDTPRSPWRCWPPVGPGSSRSSAIRRDDRPGRRPRSSSSRSRCS